MYLLILISIALSGHVDLKEEISFQTADGVTIFGDAYKTPDWEDDPVILLFHQGASNARAEYQSIIPMLLDRGYSVVAVDQRRGGDRLGGKNRTVEELGHNDTPYCEAYPDLEATLQYARSSGFGGKLIAWGSSYSAALVIQLASNNPHEISGVLAFSPASSGPLEACSPMQYLDNLQAPLLALRPQSEAEIESVQQQLQQFNDAGIDTYVSAGGVHGSSMLNPVRVSESPMPTWNVVLDFIARAIADDG